MEPHSVAPIEKVTDAKVRESYIETVDKTIELLTQAKQRFLADDNVKRLYKRLQDSVTFLRAQCQEINTKLHNDQRLIALAAASEEQRTNDKLESFLQQ